VTEFTPLDTHQAARLTVADFNLLHDAGAFADHGRAELLDGTIYVMNAEYRAHAVAKSRFLCRLYDALNAMNSDYEAVAEPSIAMPPANMPQPDIAIVRRDVNDRTFTLASVAFLVEVADSTIGFDLSGKASIYATNKIAEYWVVDIQAAVIHVHSVPVDGQYSDLRRVKMGENLSSLAVPGLSVATGDLY
jgi:Uma2 family endonuclease